MCKSNEEKESKQSNNEPDLDVSAPDLSFGLEDLSDE